MMDMCIDPTASVILAGGSQSSVTQGLGILALLIASR